MNSEQFLQSLFRSYYQKNFVTEPTAVPQREFGYGVFGKKISNRHLSFATAEAFNSFLRLQTPFFVSSSTAYYSEPWKMPMSAKGFLGGDLIYEFDADDLKTDCRQTHDSWSCSCGASGKGAIENCTGCGKPVKVEQWICPDCLGVVKKQVFRLMDFLENDFGFEGMELNFSGSKGYHVHVRSENVRQLSGNARTELIDYIMGTGLAMENLGFSEEQKVLHFPTVNSFGWAKKLNSSMVDFLENSDSEHFAVAASVTDSFAKKVLVKRQELLSAVGKGLLLQVHSVNAKNRLLWNNIVNFLVEKERLLIDRQTSIDLFKVIRVPETLHGSTGLVAKKFSFNNLSGFNPLNDAVVFSEKPVSLQIGKTPKFFLKDNWFGPFENEKAELPEYAAVFLLARGAASLLV